MLVWEADLRHARYSVFDKLGDIFKSTGLKTAKQKYSYTSSGRSHDGENVYSILHAPRGDATEAIVLVAAWRNMDGDLNRSGVALLLTLARYFKRTEPIEDYSLPFVETFVLMFRRMVPMVQGHHFLDSRRQPSWATSMGGCVSRCAFSSIGRALDLEEWSFAGRGGRRLRIQSSLRVHTHSLRWNQRSTTQPWFV